MTTQESNTTTAAVETEASNNESTETTDSGATETQYPEGVIEEPRNDEEMHLKFIKHSPSVVYDYLAVSNDGGEFLNDTQLEESVTAFINEYKDKELCDLDKPAVVISHLRSIQKVYCERIERAGTIANGILTKYGIRRGMLLIIEKKLLRMKGKQWVEHYTETYGKKNLRTAQDYMALARTPNIIRYAVFGKERLMEGLRAIKALEIESDDPMATLLDQYHIPFTPENDQSEETMMELKQGIDYAVAVTKIKKMEEMRCADIIHR